MRALKSWLAGLAALAALALGAPALAQAPTQSPIKVGALNPYSGPLALYGTEVTRGYELAVDRLNASGGVLGRRFELIRGDVTNPQQGIATVEQLVSRDKVDLFVGTYISAIALTASDAAQRYNKLYWETNALASSLTERGLPNFVRAGPDGASFAAHVGCRRARAHRAGAQEGRARPQGVGRDRRTRSTARRLRRRSAASSRPSAPRSSAQARTRRARSTSTTRCCASSRRRPTCSCRPATCPTATCCCVRCATRA